MPIVFFCTNLSQPSTVHANTCQTSSPISEIWHIKCALCKWKSTYLLHTCHHWLFHYTVPASHLCQHVKWLDPMNEFWLPWHVVLLIKALPGSHLVLIPFRGRAHTVWAINPYIFILHLLHQLPYELIRTSFTKGVSSWRRRGWDTSHYD